MGNILLKIKEGAKANEQRDSDIMVEEGVGGASPPRMIGLDIILVQVHVSGALFVQVSVVIREGLNIEFH